MPTPINFYDFARLCQAAYDPAASSVAGFSRSSDTRRWSGFQGAVYHRGNGSGLDLVVAVAGTQPTEGMGVDVVADAGFGGTSSAATLAGIVLGPVGGLLNGAGAVLLAHQCACATELVAAARGRLTAGSRLYITGHSLGGGIAQIVAARQNIQAVGISAPAVTGVPGVLAAWQRNHVPISCLRVRNDPINETSLFGAWLGRVVFLQTSRSGGAAHSVDGTLTDLSPSGAFTSLGLADPFAA